MSFFKNTLLLLTVSTATINSIASATMCSSLLNPKSQISINLNYPTIVRPPNNILRKKQIQTLLNSPNYRVIENSDGFQPHVREQCFGTCYLYANQVSIENSLKNEGIIPHGSLLLTGPLIGLTAKSRAQNLSSSTTISNLLYGGLNEALHSLNSQRVYFIDADEIKKLGSSRAILDAEQNFLKVFIEYESFKYNGKTFTEHLKSNKVPISLIVSLAFQKHIQKVYKVSLAVSSKIIHGVRYTRAYTPTNNPEAYAVGSVSTRYEETIEDVHNAFKQAFTSSDTLPNSAYKRFDGDFSKFSIPFITRRLLGGNFVTVGLKNGLFPEAHAVTITNLVINPQTNNLVGFVYLNSFNTKFGANGYGFLHAAEAAKYIMSTDAIDEIIQ